MYLNGICGSARTRSAASKSSNFKTSSFGQQLSAAKNGSAYIVPLKTENYIYYIGHGDGQDVSVEYAEDSTPEDPIVRIKGHSHSGEFDFTRHINEIDPRSASYAELCALVGYQNQIGEYPAASTLGILRPTPLGMPVGDISAQKNYLTASMQYLSSGRFSSSIRQQGTGLLQYYLNMIKK